MSLIKQTITDRIESIRVQNHFIIQVREAIQVLESGELLSQNFHRYALNPDADLSAISDPLVLAQFNAVMTDEIKQTYQTFLQAQNQEKNSE